MANLATVSIVGDRKEVSFVGGGYRMFLQGKELYQSNSLGTMPKPVVWAEWFNSGSDFKSVASLFRCIAELYDPSITPATGIGATDPLDFKLKIVQLEAERKALALKIESERAKLDALITARQRELMAKSQSQVL